LNPHDHIGLCAGETRECAPRTEVLTTPDAGALESAVSNGLPLVSVITPIYNGAEYVAECIESVLRQTYRNWEYILVDNCSTDGSNVIVERYVSRDKRLRLLRNATFLSQAENHSLGLRQISPKSKYCKIVHADDWIFPECLERMVALAESDESVGIVAAYSLEGVSIGGAGFPYAASVISGREAGRWLMLNKQYSLHTPNAQLYRAEVVRSIDPFFDERSLACDLEVAYQILQKWNLGYVHQVLSFHRQENAGTWQKVQRFHPQPLIRFICAVRYAASFFDAEEAILHCGRTEERYLRLLGECALQPMPEGFWEYHQRGLRTIGYKLTPRKLTKWLLLAVLDLVGNPKASFGRIVRSFSRKARTQLKPEGQSKSVADLERITKT
jgi:glycosyltransferase involved in cell wall biosynthesis